MTKVADKVFSVASGALVAALVAALGQSGKPAWVSVLAGLMASGVITFAVLLLDERAQDEFNEARLAYRRTGRTDWAPWATALQGASLAAAWAAGRAGYVLEGTAAVVAVDLAAGALLRWRKP